MLNSESKMLWKIARPFLSRLGEKLADYAQGTMTTMIDYSIVLESLQRNLKSLSDKAFDVEKEVKNGEQSGMKKRKREVESWLAEVRKLEMEFAEFGDAMDSDGFTSRFFGGDRAKNLSVRVEGLVEQSRHFGELLHACEPEQVPLLTKKLVGKTFEENFERILKLLVNDGVSSVGIHGMGGVGKTTLAKHIHNRFVEGAQHVVIWITVSHTFNIKNLQDEVAKAVHLDISDEKNEDKRAARLNRVLSRKGKVLLIFDDVWEKFNLEKIGDPLSLEECRLIITSRLSDVCHQIGCQEVIPMVTLNKSEALSLFTETLGAGMTLTSQVQEIAKLMAGQCGGLPLGIITAAGSMKGKTDIREWRIALKDLKESILRENGTDDEVFKILKYSFDRLGQGEKKWNGFTVLQHCFLNCCLYPEDSQISKRKLIELLISEELLDKRSSRRDRVDWGHVMLNKLVNVCLLESDGTWWVKMHDLVRAMALKITKNKYLSIDRQSFMDGGGEWSRDLKKVSLMGNGIKHIPVELSPKCPKLSTLLFQNIDLLKLIPGSFFSEMHGLHVLNLTYTDIEELPDSLSNLGSLKALLLRYCRYLKCVPSLGNLKDLRELDISFTSVKELPFGMQELVNLECLKIDSRKLEKVPSNLLVNFKKLQCLHLPSHIEAPMTEVEKLEQLEEFHGRVKDGDEFGRLMVCLQKLKEYNRSYNVFVGDILGQRRITPPAGDNEVVVNGLRVNEEGRRDVMVWPLDMEGFGLIKCEGLGSCMMDGIQGLNISNMKSCKRLRLYECKGVECILKSEEDQVEEFPLQNLESILLKKLPDLMCVVMFQSSSPPLLFSSLRELRITECNKMKKLGLPLSLSLSLLGGLQNLELLDVQRCEQVEEIFEVENRNTYNRGDEEQGNQAPSSSQRFHLPKLKFMNLIQLPKLKSICDLTLICRSLKIIHIEGCMQVKKLPLLFGDYNYDSPLLPDYHQRLSIYIPKSEKEWWESLELEHPSLHPLLKPLLRLH
ncbi:probable disease resistance protein At4g27220 [Andrographis paniculata]|uniref:probable disease resistance protein At4g27220 n=1 Tax=Andrographis paniculata TaxID=175694 RepID=UPI0021E89D5B|nr:probable disease resistance protein At4g27220 [Andrographis paniculata]